MLKISILSICVPAYPRYVVLNKIDLQCYHPGNNEGDVSSMLDQIAQLTYWVELSLIDSNKNLEKVVRFCKSSDGLTQHDYTAIGGQSSGQTVTLSLR
uniref:Uncharacterized protein n=1 Tax=Arundo donax TaxID=35708 RepID=A0A0A9CG65_ARUDO